jgi:hypothetical protein
MRFAAVAARPPQRLGHSVALHSHAVAEADFASPGFCFAKPLLGLAKRRNQPERYVKCAPKLVKNMLD